MMILVVGDVEPKEVFGQIEESIDAKSSKPEIKRIFPENPKQSTGTMLNRSLRLPCHVSNGI